MSGICVYIHFWRVKVGIGIVDALVCAEGSVAGEQNLTAALSYGLYPVNLIKPAFMSESLQRICRNDAPRLARSVIPHTFGAWCACRAGQ